MRKREREPYPKNTKKNYAIYILIRGRGELISARVKCFKHTHLYTSARNCKNWIRKVAGRWITKQKSADVWILA